MTSQVEPLRITIDIACPPQHAFAVWTQRIDTWWPRDHTVGDVAAVVLQEGVGGRIFERGPDGAERDWGRVTAWEPPTRLAYTWHIGRSANEATDVEVRFLAADTGTTRVVIEQSGWERFGEQAGPWRERNKVGWDSLLPHFVSVIERNA